MAKGSYVKVYQSIVEDPMFEHVFNNDHALATWLRMLLVADAIWPVSAEMPRRNPTVQLLIRESLVIQRPFNRYSIRGLDAEREHRSASGRHAAALRWQSVPNAKQNKTEQNREGRNATASPTTFMGFKQRPDPRKALADIERQHAASLEEALKKHGMKP